MLSLVTVKFSPAPAMLVPTFSAVAGGILEISADGLLDLLAGAEQPEHDEQGHHGGDEIGVGHFPRTAVMAAVASFFLDDDDGAGSVHGVSGLAGLLRPRCGRGGCLRLGKLFEFLEGGADVAGNGAARHFHGHDGRGALQKRDLQDAQHVEDRRALPRLALAMLAAMGPTSP